MADKKISALTAATTPLAGTEVLPIVQGGATVKVSVDNLTTGKVVTTGPIISVGTGKDRLVIEPQNAGSGALLLGTNAAGNAYTPVLIDGSLTKLSVGGVEVARTNGNGIAPVAGKGIDFSANSNAPGMTSELLNWYEEGTWTPVIGGSSSAGTGTYTAQVGRYTRIGRTVHFTAYVVWSAHTGTGNMYLSGLPYASENTANVFFQFSPFSSNLAYTANSQLQLLLFNNATTLNFYQINGGAAASQVAIDTAADVLVTGTYSI